MNEELRNIPPAPLEFIRLYASTLKANYDEFFSAMQLMRSDPGVVCPVRAAELAQQLQQMHGEFDQTIALIANRHQAVPKKSLPWPSLDALTQLLQISFFKLVVPHEGDNGVEYEDKGWFSGHPLSWEETLEKATPPLFPHPPSAIMQAFISLLGSIVSGNYAEFGFSAKSKSLDAEDHDAEYEDEDDSFEDFDQDTDY